MKHAAQSLKTIGRLILLPALLGLLAGGAAALSILRYIPISTALPETREAAIKSQRPVAGTTADYNAAINNLVFFFKTQPQTDYLTRSDTVGTGFALTSDGLVATLIAVDKQKLKAVTFEKTVHDLRPLDSKTKASLKIGDSNLNFVKLESARLKAVPFADIEQLKIGNTLMVFDQSGNLKFKPLLSAGRHDVPRDRVESSEELTIFPRIDTDVAAGSIVYSTAGELAGIALTEGRLAPAELIKMALTRYIRSGAIKKIYLGINFLDLNQMTPINPGLPKTGLLLKDGSKGKAIIKGGPAEKAGLRAGDILLALEGAALNDNLPFQMLLQRYQPGSEVEFTVLRKGREEKVRVALGEK